MQRVGLSYVGAIAVTQRNATNAGTLTEGDQFHVRAAGFRMTANELQRMMNGLASGDAIPHGSEIKLFGYFFSITVLRALSAECMLKAIACARSGSFKYEHDLLELFEALDGETKGLIGKIADSQGVASPRRVLKRHRKDFVDWRYPAEGETQSTTLLDLEKVLQILHDVYLRIKGGKGPWVNCLGQLPPSDTQGTSA